jgi:hypothetical protein
MAWRMEEAVEHGFIDNTIEGQTTGKIWIKGRDEPLILSLNGDCLRDLAGTYLEFENPNPIADSQLEELDTEQVGIVGDITASRKARIPEISVEEMDKYEEQGREIPFLWGNVLYLEWFSEINGRVLIETADFILKSSAHEWHMDEDQEEAQKLANLSAMRDFMMQVIGRTESETEVLKKRHKTELNEFQWEQRLKESDRLSDAYEEVLEKYMEDHDCERKEAFVMGWDGLLSAMAERDEKGEDDQEFDDEEFSESWYDDEEGDEDEDEEWLQSDHPLQIRARELAIQCFAVVNDEDPDSAAQQLASSMMQVSGKMAGVLHGSDEDYNQEAGFVLAVLKRCLNWLNDAIGFCAELIETSDDITRTAELESIRSEIFAIRDGIIEIRRSLK